MAKPRRLTSKQTALLEGVASIYKSHKDTRSNLYSLVAQREEERKNLEKYKKVLQDRYKRAIKEGVPKSQIAKKLGVTPQAIYSWLDNKQNQWTPK